MSHKILVVDDIESNVIFLSEILRHEGHDVLAAYSGKQALEIVQTEAPSIILLDVMMPEMDGFEVCLRLKANPASRNIVVIFITALEESQHVVHGFGVGGADYISKPFNIKEIIARINTQIQLVQQRDSLEDSFRQVSRLQNAMNSYLSKSARESIENSVFGDSYEAFKPQRRILTVMFTDIANFTSISEALEPEMLITDLTIYIAMLTSIIYQRKGEVDKFLGDGLLAYFEDAQSALLASCEIQSKLNEFNYEQEKQAQPRFDTRIGLATGMVLQANLGFDERREITILGDRVNTAARLQANAPIGGMLMDELTYHNAEKPAYSAIETHILKGKQQTEVTYMIENDLALKLL